MKQENIVERRAKCFPTAMRLHFETRSLHPYMVVHRERGRQQVFFSFIYYIAFYTPYFEMLNESHISKIPNVICVTNMKREFYFS